MRILNHLGKQSWRLVAFLVTSLLVTTPSFAATFERHVRLTVDEDQLTAIQSAGLEIIQISTGFSEAFEPAQLSNTDILNVHVEFFDQQGNQVYVVLRDLGGGYLDPNGWQWFQAAVGLNVGTVSGTYVNGWVFEEANPRLLGNYACCTRTAVSQSIIESAGFAFEVTDDSIILERLRIQFNFNSPSDPVVITDGGGFNRLSLVMRAEDIVLLRVPYTTEIRGPWSDNGIALDVNRDGVVDQGSGDQMIGIDFGEAQHFRYKLGVYPAVPGPADFAYPIFLPEGFEFDPLGEENFDGCQDGICDGLSSCMVTVSGPILKKKGLSPRYAVIEPTDPFLGSRCAYSVHIVTIGEGKGQKISFSPTQCESADTSLGGVIHSLVRLSNGVQIYDNVTSTLFEEKLVQQLEPFGCN